jgi:hypothetical protein
MLTFVIFDADGVNPRLFPPRHAHQVGPDEIPVQGAVRIDTGLINAEKQAPQTSGVVLQCAVGRPEGPAARPAGWTGANLPNADGSLGLLTIQTCLLPERPTPYLLNIELARHRIMLFLNKLEDWGLTDLPADNPVMQEFEQARQAFTESLVAQRGGLDGEPKVAEHSFCPKADKLATSAVSLAIDAGEGLTLINADRQLRSRLSGRAYQDAVEHLARLTPETPPPGTPILIPGSGQVVLPGRPAIGCAMSPAAFSEPLQKAVMASCDFITMPMRWLEMEPVEGKYSFTQTDRWIEWAVRTAKLPVIGGPLVDFRPQATPDFLFIWENDYETLRDLVQEHITAIVTRYRRTVSRWTVASGLHVNTNFKISFEQIMDLTRLCVLLVRKLQPTAKVQVEIAQPWGEYHAVNRRSIPPYLYAEAMVQAGIQVDAFALRLQMGHAEPGCSTRDLMSLSAILDRFAALEKPLTITSLGCPSAPITPAPYRPRAGAQAEDPYEPGSWRAPWSDATQAEWLTQAMAICCSKPFVHSVCWQELYDAPSTASGGAAEMPFGGLISSNGQAKPALSRLAQIRATLRDGKSPLALGNIAVR